jgi:DNA-binding response OmpR family regulator
MSPEPRIVLIDDDRHWLETMAEYLQRKGYAVQTAPDGTTGLALLENGDVALALVDGHMPDMDGLDLLRRLRRLCHRPAVIMLSSDDDPSLPARAVAEGATCFLAKTITPRLLLGALNQILDADAWRRWLPVPVRIGRYLPVPIPTRRS